MSDHWKQIAENTPIGFIGMITARADMVLDAIPVIWKVLSLAAICTAAFFDLKGDIRVLASDVAHYDRERIECCQSVNRKIEKLEDKHSQ